MPGVEKDETAMSAGRTGRIAGAPPTRSRTTRRFGSLSGAELAFLFLCACPKANPMIGEDAAPSIDASIDAAIEDASIMDGEITDAEIVDASDPIDAAGEDAAHDAGETRDAAIVDASEPDSGIEIAYWANTQWPPYLTLAPGARATVYGQIWVDGRTPGAGAALGIEAELGLGPVGSDPSTWNWIPAAYNVDVGNNDEYAAELIAPASGAYDYAFRYRIDGSPWLVADRTNGARAKLAVRETNATLRIATLNLHCLADDPAARLDAAAARFTALGTDIVALQEVCEGAPVTNSAEYLALALSASTGRTWRHYFVQTHLANGATPEGLGVITALPIAETITLDLPIADFPRKSIIAIAASPIGMIAFATAHLSFRLEDGQARLDQARALIAQMDQLGGTDIAAAIVAGDYNSTPLEPPPAEMVGASFIDAFADAHPGENGFTYSSTNPTRRIDYLFVRPVGSRALEVTAAEVEFAQPYAPQSYVSDHRGVSAEITAR